MYGSRSAPQAKASPKQDADQESNNYARTPAMPDKVQGCSQLKPKFAGADNEKCRAMKTCKKAKNKPKTAATKKPAAAKVIGERAASKSKEAAAKRGRTAPAKQADSKAQKKRR